MAIEKSKEYNNSKFVYISVNRILNTMNNFIIKVVRKLFKLEFKTLLMKRVVKELKKNHFDCVVVEGNEVQVLQIKKYYDGNLYFHAHHDAFNTCNGNPNEIISACNKVMVVSEYIKNRTLEACGNNNKVEVVRNCTNTSIFNKNLYFSERSVLRRKYNIKDDEIAIMFTGRIIKEKGIKELIEAFKIICNDEKIKLIIVGNAGFANEIISSYDKELLELSKDISEKIVFTGFIHNSELPKIHSMVDIAVVPSIWEEPAGLVAIEALSSGLPLIITNSGGLPEYVSERCAIIVEKDENMIMNIAYALKKLINSEELRKNMAIEARKQAYKYDIKNYYDDYITSLKG